MTLTELHDQWIDEPEWHVHINDLFTDLVNRDEDLNQHRTFIETHVYGMGERSFQWFWKILVDEMPDDFKFIEQGVHKAQIVSLIRLLADRIGKQCAVYGITPMNGAGTGWNEDDYEGDIKRIHKCFGLSQPELYKGYSQDQGAIDWANNNGPYDICYTDGDHSYSGCYADLENYAPMVKSGGYLVIDDAMCDAAFPATGFFTGIAEVTQAKIDYMSVHQSEWEWIGNVVHLAVYRRL